MLVRTSVLALDQAVRVMFNISDSLELWLDDRRLGQRLDDRDIELPLTGDVLPEDLVAVHVRGQIGSTEIDACFEPEPNLYFKYRWDGTSPDPEVPGASPTSLVTELEVGWEMAAHFPRSTRIQWWRNRVVCGGVDLRTLGCGGISPKWVHQLDVEADILWRGDGSRLAGAQRRPSRLLDRLRIRPDELAVADGQLAHIFDHAGNMRRTLSALKGTVMTTVKTDESGRIASWADVGHRYTIDRRSDSEALIRSPGGVWVVVDFDDDGRAVALTDQTRSTVAFEWSESGGLSGITESGGLITKIERDDEGRVIRFVDSTGRQLDLVSDETATGSRVSVITGEGRETSHSVERLPDGTTIATHHACGGSAPRIIERRSLGALGEEQVVRSPDGTVTTTRRSSRTDDEHAIEVARTSITSPTGLTKSVDRRTDYHRSGRTVERLTMGDSTWLKNLAPETYTTSSRSPEGRATISSIDPGNSLSVTTPRSGTLTVNYDDQQRPRERRHNGSRVTYGYDKDGRLSWTDFERWRQQIRHDQRGRVVAIETADGWLQFGRDGAGRVAFVTSPNGSVTAIERRPDGEIETIKYPSDDDMSLVERLSYDRDGLLVGRSFDESHKITFKRDARGRVATTVAPGVEIAVTHDESSGQVVQVETSMGEAVHYEHDGELEVAEVAHGRAAGRIERRFDENHLVKSRTVNDSHELHYGRDRDGLITSVGPLQIEYDPAGAAVALTLGGLETTREYDAEGRLSRQITRMANTKKALFSERIERDSLGRVIEIAEQVQGVDRLVTYRYDEGRRLIEAEVDGEVTLNLGYDGNGNIVELERQGRPIRLQVDAGDRIVSIAGARTSHDFAGNLTGIGDQATVRGYRFDGLSRLVGFVDARGAAVEHVLDAWGRPIETSGNAIHPLRLLWDGNRVAATLDDDGEVDMRFIDSGSGAAPQALIRNGVAYLLVADHLGSVRYVINSRDGEVVQAVEYDALGRVTTNTAPGWQPFGFAGGLHEPTSGMVRFGERTYDPFIGRFLSRDPLGLAGGQLNLYQYANGDPVNQTDPSGLRGIVSDGVDLCTDPFIGARPLTLDHVYLRSADWQRGMNPVATLGSVKSSGPDGLANHDLQTRNISYVDRPCSPQGQDPSSYGAEPGSCYGSIWNTLDSCADPGIWEYDPSSWSHDPGFLETVGRVMQLGATTKKWLPTLKPNLSRLVDSLSD